MSSVLVFIFTNSNINEINVPKEIEKKVYFNTEYDVFMNSLNINTTVEGHKFLVISTIHENIYHLMMETRFPYYSTHFYVGKKKSLNLEEILEDYYSKKEEENMKNIFSFINDENRIYILELFEVLTYFLDAGFHCKENRKRIPDWIVSCETPIMFRYIEIMKFENIFLPSEITWCETLCSNPEFRKSLTYSMFNVFQYIIQENKMKKYRKIDIDSMLDIKDDFIEDLESI